MILKIVNFNILGFIEMNMQLKWEEIGILYSILLVVLLVLLKDTTMSGSRYQQLQSSTSSS